MASLFSKTGSIKYLLYAIDVFTKYAWVKKLLKDKNGKTVLNISIVIVPDWRESQSSTRFDKFLLLKRIATCNKC